MNLSADLNKNFNEGLTTSNRQLEISASFLILQVLYVLSTLSAISCSKSGSITVGSATVVIVAPVATTAVINAAVVATLVYVVAVTVAVTVVAALVATVVAAVTVVAVVAAASAVVAAASAVVAAVEINWYMVVVLFAVGVFAILFFVFVYSFSKLFL